MMNDIECDGLQKCRDGAWRAWGDFRELPEQEQHAVVQAVHEYEQEFMSVHAYRHSAEARLDAIQILSAQPTTEAGINALAKAIESMRAHQG